MASLERRTTLADLPHVTLLLICRLSGTRASLRFQLTCKDFASIVNDDYLWKLLVTREWRGVNPSLSYWAPIQSWRSVYHFMNEYGKRRSPVDSLPCSVPPRLVLTRCAGDFEGCFRLLNFFPYGLLCAVHFEPGVGLVCAALLPLGVARLFEAAVLPDGTLGSVRLLPRTGHTILCTLARTLPTEERFQGFDECPSLSQLVCSVGDEARTQELRDTLDRAILDAGDAQAEHALLGLVGRLWRGDYTSRDHMHYYTSHFVLAKLMLQPAWRAVENIRADPSWEQPSLAQLHGTLWHGDYGEHYGVHRVETIQIIICARRDLRNLCLLEPPELARVVSVAESLSMAGFGGRVATDGTAADPDLELFMLGLKVTGDPHVRMGSVSMIVPLTASNGTMLDVEIPAQQQHELRLQTGRDGHAIGSLLHAFSGAGTLAYLGYRNPSWNAGTFMALESDQWLFSWGQNQAPVVFRRLQVGAGMSFVEPTNAREGPSAAAQGEVGAPTQLGRTAEGTSIGRGQRCIVS